MAALAQGRDRENVAARAEIRGEALLTLARLRPATPHQLHRLLLPHQQGTDYIRRALRDLRAESPALVGRAQRAQQGYWYCTPAGLAEAAASGALPPGTGSRPAARRAAAKTGLREHALAVVDAAIAFHHTGVADVGDWHLEVAHPTPAGTLIPDAVVLLADGHTAFVEVDHGMLSHTRPTTKPARYAAYRTAPPARPRHRRPHHTPPLTRDLRRRPRRPVFPAGAGRLRPRAAPRRTGHPRGGLPPPRGHCPVGAVPAAGRGDHDPAAADRARARSAGVAGGRPR